ncbi:T9SS type A sorting domain-containing protein [Hymenobacter sp. NBH84]|uniref:T9SS type A sorting domain-containing protein n=1 Tax=Hymenobacter sp. NBH84 TaxID=2596915 RepID=UPI001860B19A|nr:T9SS type A sorting domain-containing protein [Hymenobacter sp. NBH84]QNE38933.1 T9SS type A sorting domain-containing protein [Hymenobacter sp. NBH84]
MSAKGFRGGGGFAATTATTTAYVSSSTVGNGSKGEGTAGIPTQVFDGTSVSTVAGSDYVGGSHAAGAPGNAGGGATDFTTNNTGNAGGGGGSNASAGGLGGYGYNSGSTGIQAQGGRAASTSTTRLLMGGGGGAGSINVGTASNSSGGVGGGIIILRSGPIAPTSGTSLLSVQANGGNAPTADNAVNTTSNLQGAGGGGAGGTAIVMAFLPDGTPASLANVAINANGGNGGNAGYTGSNRLTRGYGPGGGGSGGIVYTNTTTAISTSAGVAGQTLINTNGNNTALSTYGAGPGNAGTSTTNTATTATATIGGAGSCLPVLTASLSTSTPNVTRANSTTVNPATYTLTVSNTGGVATEISAATTLAANLFKYDNTFTPTVTLTLADGSTSTVTGYTGPTSNTGTPTFSNLTIPAGASLSIQFRATIASAAVNGTVYNASSTISYTNPMRDGTTATATVAPKGNYAGGTNTSLGAAGGSNYDGTVAANTAENVTIVQPLPVELVRFEATTAHLDAKLSWTTASEKNNAYFEVQRSLTGTHFETVGKITGQGSTQQKTNYTYTDAGAGRLLDTKTIYYRLRQVDYDGQESFSLVRTVAFEQLTKLDAALYPNPASQTATLDLTGLPTGTYQVRVLDLVGHVISQQTLSGGQLHTLQVQQLPQGSYLIMVNGGTVHLNLKLVHN